MQNNLVKFPVKRNSKIDNTAKSPQRFTAIIENNSLNEVGIYEGDELLIDATKAINNGNLVIIESGGNLECGFALFLDDGKLMLTFYNTRFAPVTYDLSEIKIIGRVLYSSRDWRYYAHKLEAQHYV